MKEAALKYHNLGLSVIPVNENKLPIGKWTANMQQLIQPNGNFENAFGVGICCGKVSGNLEVIDVDCKYDLTGKLFETYKRLIADQDKGLLNKMVVEKTKKNGYHLIYRCSEIEGNKKLASRYTTDDEKKINEKERVKVLIETRGEGGYVMVCPSPGYNMVFNDFDRIQVITPQEREILMACARSMNEVFEPVRETTLPQESEGGNIFQEWINNGDVLGLLEREGWTITRQKGSKYLMLRPGGEGKWSADWDSQKRLFYVWTSSSEFENDRAYNALQVLMYLKFQRTDYKGCAEYLRAEGYGKEYVKPKTPASVISLDDDNFDFISDATERRAYTWSVKTGTFKKGLSTGIPTLDEFFVFKPGNLNIINGMDNVGKSTVIWYLMLLASLNHGWKWIVLANENSPGYVQRKLMEFYTCSELQNLSDAKYHEAQEWVEKHFTIIKSEEMWSYVDVMRMAEKLNINWNKGTFGGQYNGILIDPYNSLKINLADTSKLGVYEYHYQAASELRGFAKRNNMLVFLNCHVVTSALRTKTSDGHPAAPMKADTEQGGMFANKADDFLTIHRYTQHPTDWMLSQIHVRKIKEQETGGKLTYLDNPYLLKMLPGRCGFEDIDGYNPVLKRNDRRQPISTKHTYSFEGDDTPF